jgi:hypothetical protein
LTKQRGRLDFEGAVKLAGVKPVRPERLEYVETLGGASSRAAEQPAD